MPTTAPPKTPTDHQPKQVTAPDEDVKPEGWELCKPADELMAWDRARLLAAVAPVQAHVKPDGTVTVDTGTPELLEMMADLMELMQGMVTDRDAYRKLASGKDGLERAMQLSMWFASRLGE